MGEVVIYSINAVMPLVLLIGLGYFLKRINLLSPDFLKKANKLCFKVFIPFTLFMNIYNIDSLKAIDFRAPLFCVVGIIVSFFIGLVAVKILVPETRQKGVVLQCVFRANYAIIGIPLASLLCGEEGAAMASLLAAFSVPTFNILAVLALTIFNREEKSVLNENGEVISYEKAKFNIKKVSIEIAKNPLIHGVLIGVAVLLIRMLFVKIGWSFTIKSNAVFLYKSFTYLNNITTPLALIVLGGQFELCSFKNYKKQIIIGTVFRLIVIPIILLGIACFVFKFKGAAVAAFVAAFGTPVAVASAIMAQEMGGDGELAGALVVSTTVFSTFSLIIIVAVLKAFAFVG